VIRWIWLLCLFVSPVYAWDWQAEFIKVRWQVAQQNIVLGEEVALDLEIATPNWFTEAAVIELPSDGQALWLQPQTFAQNSRERIDNASWSLQRWSLVLLPRESGYYQAKDLRVAIGVADSNGKTVSYDIALPAPMFNVVNVPIDVSVIARDLSVQRTISDLDTLVAGDSFEISYSIEAEGTLAMFLPSIEPAFEGSAQIKLYPGLPNLKDERVRGIRKASRQQVFSVVVEKSGSIEISTSTIKWLTSGSHQVNVLTLPRQMVFADSLTNAELTDNALSDYLIWMALISIGLLMEFVGMLATRSITPLSAKRFARNKQMLLAASEGNWSQVASDIYALRDSYTHWRGVRMADLLLAQCNAQVAERISAILSAAYSANHLLRDESDTQWLRHYATQLEKNG
jgi:hypothetical protein